MTQNEISGSTIKTILCLVLIISFYDSAVAAPPAPPNLFVSIDGTKLYLTWNAADGADGYTLYYAPYPSADPVSTIDIGDSTIISGELPLESAFYVALQSYNSDGRDGYSNIEHFDIQGGDFKSPHIDFTFGGAVAFESETLIRNSTIRSEAFFRSQGLPTFSSPLTVYAYEEYDELVAAYASFRGVSISQSDEWWSGGVGGVAQANSFWINLNSDSWTCCSEWRRASIMAHELFHILQFQMRGYVYAVGTPTWLAEGSAHLAAHLMLDWAGMWDFEYELQEIRRREATNRPTLIDLETGSGFNSATNPYQIVLLAVALLTEDLSDFEAYYSALANTTSWQVAFTQSFGRSVEAFYEEFEAYQGNGYQP